MLYSQLVHLRVLINTNFRLAFQNVLQKLEFTRKDAIQVFLEDVGDVIVSRGADQRNFLTSLDALPTRHLLCRLVFRVKYTREIA